MYIMCAQVIQKATLDGVMFRTMKGEAKTRSRNSCVAEGYKDRDNGLEYKDAYGCIKAMFEHRLGSRTEIIVECDYYEVVGVNPRTKLTMIRRNHNFDRCRVNFLKKLYPQNMSFWPSNLSNSGDGLLDVIKHHDE